MRDKRDDPKNQKMENVANQNKSVDVLVLHNEGCTSTPMTIELIEACVLEMGIKMNFQKILVNTHLEANELHFLGSPTIQINGIDIDPSVRDANVFGFM